jgi:hypothetical protein
MFTCKKLAALAVVIVAGTTLAAPADAISLAQKPSAHLAAKVDVQYYRGYRRSARNYRGYRRYARRNRGIYSRSFMNCINSGNPLDFCQQVHGGFGGSR